MAVDRRALEQFEAGGGHHFVLPGLPPQLLRYLLYLHLLAGSVTFRQRHSNRKESLGQDSRDRVDKHLVRGVSEWVL